MKSNKAVEPHAEQSGAGPRILTDVAIVPINAYWTLEEKQVFMRQWSEDHPEEVNDRHFLPVFVSHPMTATLYTLNDGQSLLRLDATLKLQCEDERDVVALSDLLFLAVAIEKRFDRTMVSVGLVDASVPSEDVDEDL